MLVETSAVIVWGDGMRRSYGRIPLSCYVILYNVELNVVIMNLTCGALETYCVRIKL